MSEHASSILIGCILIGAFGTLMVASLRTRKTSRTATYEGSNWTAVAGGDAGAGHGHGHDCGGHGGDWGGDCGGHGGGH